MVDFTVDPDGNIKDCRHQPQGRVPPPAPPANPFLRDPTAGDYTFIAILCGVIFAIGFVRWLITGELPSGGVPRNPLTGARSYDPAQAALEKAKARADQTAAARRQLEEVERQLTALERQHSLVVPSAAASNPSSSRDSMAEAALIRNRQELERLSSDVHHWENTWSFHFRTAGNSEEWANAHLAAAKERLRKMGDSYRRIQGERVRQQFQR